MSVLPAASRHVFFTTTAVKFFVYNGAGAAEIISKSKIKCLAPFCFINKKLLEVRDSEEEFIIFRFWRFLR